MSEASSPTNPQGSWGPFGQPNLSPIGNLYGWALIAGDGTVTRGSGNLSCTHLGAGAYQVRPANTSIPADRSFAVAINAVDAPMVLATLLNVGPDSNWVIVNSYLSSTGVLTDNDFVILYFTSGNTPF